MSIFSEMSGSAIYEANPFGNQNTADPGLTDQPDNAGTEPAEFTPLKKYFLIEKLNELKYKLADRNIVNEDLEFIIKFSPSLSYETLANLVNTLSEAIQSQLQGIKNEK